MNNKGEVEIGQIILLFVGIIVALVLFVAASQQITTVVDLSVVTNSTITFPTNTTALALNGQAVSNFVALNATSAVVVPSTNYTITNYAISNTGTLQATIIGLGANPHGGKTVNVSYTYEPLGYAKESASRTITELIVILSALAIAAWVISKVYEEGVDAFR